MWELGIWALARLRQTVGEGDIQEPVNAVVILKLPQSSPPAVTHQTYSISLITFVQLKKKNKGGKKSCSFETPLKTLNFSYYMNL